MDRHFAIGRITVASRVAHFEEATRKQDHRAVGRALDRRQDTRSGSSDRRLDRSARCVGRTTRLRRAPARGQALDGIAGVQV